MLRPRCSGSAGICAFDLLLARHSMLPHLRHFSRRFIGGPSRQKPRIRPTLEPLEGRSLLTVVPIDFGATMTSPPVAMSGVLYFSATEAAHGDELWRSDGTAAGTYLLKDIRPGVYKS